MDYNFKAIEKKWQKKWEDKKIFQVKESKKKKFYVLDMFPYPSGEGLHIGHAFVFSLGDIFARFKRMNGFNVLYPVGFDSLGLPAENAAIKAGTHPEEYTKKSIANFIKQQKAMGWSYDWSRMVKSSDPKFYKWDQWIFLKMFEKGIAYRKKAPVNWCSKCNTVLANEQVHDGKCWRHDNVEIEIKHLEQWFFRITDYAEDLLKGLEKVNWPERAKIMQKNWIGKSHGTEIDFEINGKKWPIFTTRPDTLFGVTFMVISAQHNELMNLVTEEQKNKVEKFLKKIKSTSEKDAVELEKEGVFTGSYARNLINGKEIPVWVGNFVLADYGSGMVMAVPAHDQRDFEFAKKYNIGIRQVIAPLFVTSKGSDAVKNNRPVIERDAVLGIVKHWKEDKYFVLDWKKFGWKSLIIGGMEKGETPEEAITREVIEETGYQDIKSVTLVGFEAHAKFFARHKDINRYGKFKTFLVELNSKKYSKPKSKHIKNHKGFWIDKNKIKGYLNLKDNLYGWENHLEERAYSGEGVLINSGKFNKINSEKARDEITKDLAKKKLGRKIIQYKLRDWLISRQRYWGTPIPIVYCDKCGLVPIDEKELPIELPSKIRFGKGNPLTTNSAWVNTKCPKCKGKARRETDTMDTFVNSSWYYLRYTDPKNDKKIFNSKKANYWAPIDQYIGGPEHITCHLLYIRFYTKFLKKIGLLKFDEPALKYFTQGVVKGADGERMSKSKGNVVEPLDTVKKYGADSLRLFLVSVANPDTDFDWSEKGIQGSFKFVRKISNYFDKVQIGELDARTESKINKTILEVEEYIENFKYNLAVIKLRELFEALPDKTSKEILENSLRLLHPFCPHVTEELWEKLGNKNFLSLEKWPKANKKKVNEFFEKQDKAISKLISDINQIFKLVKNKEKVYVYVLPNEKKLYDEILINKWSGRKISIFAVNDKNKYDPSNISKKTKPGRPAIYLE